MRPSVTVGLPVFNGERFVARAIESYLRQNYTSFEIVISDNASTDATEEICRAYARQDDRIRYYRNPSNFGAAKNFNRVVELARGRYFKWAAHDDWCAPSFLRRCVDELERDPAAILCFTAMGVCDDSGSIFRTYQNVITDMTSTSPQQRLHGVLWSLRDPTAPIFGLIRTDALRRSGLIRNATEADRILLGELSLLGSFRCINEVLFFHYAPQGHLYHYAPDGVRRSRRQWVWLDPANASRPKVASLRILVHHLQAVRGAGLPTFSRICCYADVLTATGLTRMRNKAFRLYRKLRRQAVARLHVNRGRDALNAQVVRVSDVPISDVPNGPAQLDCADVAVER